jgi:glycosyltransferase involved in cell wall biosynthesis
LGGEQVQSDFHSLDRRTNEPTRKQFLGSLNLPEGVRLIGAVGPLTTNARIKDLIWAAELLRVVDDETHLLIAGEGPEEWRLHRFRDQVGIRHRVRFLGKRIDYRQWLPLLDFFWSGSKTGNSPLYVLEAMSVGLPVVATDIAAHRELITAAENGFLVRPGDRAAFARYTWRMMNDNVECRRIGNAAIQSVAKRFVPIVAAGQSSDQVPL